MGVVVDFESERSKRLPAFDRDFALDVIAEALGGVSAIACGGPRHHIAVAAPPSFEDLEDLKTKIEDGTGLALSAISYGVKAVAGEGPVRILTFRFECTPPGRKEPHEMFAPTKRATISTERLEKALHIRRGDTNADHARRRTLGNEFVTIDLTRRTTGLISERALQSLGERMGETMAETIGLLHLAVARKLERDVESFVMDAIDRRSSSIGIDTKADLLSAKSFLIASAKGRVVELLKASAIW